MELARYITIGIKGFAICAGFMFAAIASFCIIAILATICKSIGDALSKGGGKK